MVCFFYLSFFFDTKGTRYIRYSTLGRRKETEVEPSPTLFSNLNSGYHSARGLFKALVSFPSFLGGGWVPFFPRSFPVLSLYANVYTHFLLMCFHFFAFSFYLAGVVTVYINVSEHNTHLPP